MYTSNYPPGMSNEDLDHVLGVGDELDDLPVVCEGCEEEVADWDMKVVTMYGRLWHSACGLDLLAEMEAIDAAD
jgi:hypothetical protein